MPKTIYRLDLTPHERAALLTVISEHITRPDAPEVSVDAVTGEEIEISSFVKRLLDLAPQQVD